MKSPILRADVYKNIGEKLFLTFHQNYFALKLLEKSEELNRSDYYTYFLLGRVYFVEGVLNKSISNYSNSIELNQNYKETYYGRGLSYGFSGPVFYSDAEQDFKKYIEIENTEFEKTGNHAYGAWAGYNDLAWVYFLEGDFNNSEKTARSGLKIAPNIPWLENMLGTALLAQKKCAEAKIHLKIADEQLKNTTVEKFGEAYSGDNPDFWKVGKEQMSQAIQENMKICDSQNN